MKIVVLDARLTDGDGRSWAPVARYGEFIRNDLVPDGADPADLIGDADIVFTNRTGITAGIMDRCPNLRMIGTLGTGYNVIDIAAAKERGIAVFNAPGYSRGAVAQMTIALLLCIVRNIREFDRHIKEDGWMTAADPYSVQVWQMELTGKTLGIIGMGDIGYAVAKIAMAMDMEVLAFRRHPDRSLESEHLRFAPLDEVVSRADVISVHCPLTDETRGMIDKELIVKMKDGVIFLNTSRGALMNEADIAAALDSGKIRAAGIDTFAVEPCGRDHILASHPKCVATQHVAWAPAETRDRLIRTCADNIETFLEGGNRNRIV